MQLEIKQSAKLALADAKDVLLEIEAKGFYLQLTDTISLFQPSNKVKNFKI